MRAVQGRLPFDEVEPLPKRALALPLHVQQMLLGIEQDKVRLIAALVVLAVVREKRRHVRYARSLGRSGGRSAQDAAAASAWLLQSGLLRLDGCFFVAGPKMEATP